MHVRHKFRSTVVAATSALLLTAGAGTASAQGSLALPFPVDIPGLSSLFGGSAPAANGALAPAGLAPVAVPAEVGQQAFQGRVVAAANEARGLAGAERLVTDPLLQSAAEDRAAQLAEGVDDAEAPAAETAETEDRIVLELPAGSTPQKALTAIVSDPELRERMLDSEFSTVGVGMAVDDDETVHVVMDFSRG